MDDTRYVCDIDMRITHFDIGETIAQRRRRAGIFKSTNPGPPPERRSTISSMSSSYQVTRMRNLSGGSSGSAASGSSTCSLDNQYCSQENPLYFSMDNSPFANTSPLPHLNEDSMSSSHRKLDRSLSDTDSERSNGSHRSVNSSRYKTELCRPFEESGSCKYGDKCQFAHGSHELRNLARHPKYKTEPCRTFHTIGFCPYGPRCHFIHEDDKSDSCNSKSNSGTTSPSLSPNENHNFSYSDTSLINKSLSVNINYGNDLDSLEQQFSSALNLNRAVNSSRNAFNNNDEEFDIFSSISVFNADEVNDNSPPSTSYSSQSSRLDNYSYQGFGNIPQYWSNLPSQSLAPIDSFHHSPTGSSSSVSDSGLSDCSSGCSTSSGSTESLAGYNLEWNPHHYRHTSDCRPFQQVY